jgi:UDP-glucose:(heptosyl)LPS alpha-1,3-glucosyltransferase
VKIALVSSKYDPNAGGMEQWQHRHAKLLLREGHVVQIIAAEINNPPDRTICQSVSQVPTGLGGKRLAVPDRLAAVLSTIQADVIHDMGVGWYCDLFMPHHGTRPAVFKQQTKLLTLPERTFRPLAFNCLPRYLRFKALERKQFSQLPNHNGKLFLAVSDMVADQMKQYYHVPDEQIRVVYNGANIDRFTPSESDENRTAIRKRYNVNHDTVLFLIVAHDWDLKGLYTIFKSLRALKNEDSNVKLAVVGPGKMKGLKCWGIPLGKPFKRYPKLAKKWGIEDRVIFASGQDDPVPWYHAADVYVQPSIYDACSLVVLEAMACGLPSITSATNGVSRLITHGEDGLVIDDPQDHASLVHLMKLTTDSELRTRMGIAARKLLETYTEERNYQGIIKVYEEIIENRKSLMN